MGKSGFSQEVLTAREGLKGHANTISERVLMRSDDKSVAAFGAVDKIVAALKDKRNVCEVVDPIVLSIAAIHLEEMRGVLSDAKKLSVTANDVSLEKTFDYLGRSVDFLVDALRSGAYERVESLRDDLEAEVWSLLGKVATFER